MKGGGSMRRVLGVIVLIVVVALAAGLAFPPAVPAGAPAGAPDAEKQKVIELLKLQLLLSRGEHGQFHALLEKLVKKYPADADVKGLSDAYHDTMHKRMTAQEQLSEQLLSRGYLTTP